MNGHASSFTELDHVLAQTHHLLLDFDGPICSLFARTPAEPVADRLRKLITSENTEIPPHVEATRDWFEILAYAYSVSPVLAARVADELTEIETTAVSTAVPTAYAHDVIAACRESGRGIAIISNNSERAVRAYLDAHDLTHQIAIVAARTEPDPGKLKPGPYLIARASEALGSRPVECALVGDATTDVQAARASGACPIGYTRTPADAGPLTAAGAQVIVESMATLALQLRAHPLPN